MTEKTNRSHATGAKAAKEIFSEKPLRPSRPLREAKSIGALHLGFVPLTDCAPLVMAQELGLFKKYGLNVILSRELGWATIRDKIIHRELDAAHAVTTT
ncbi:MAG: ABC transporter substrate-binding protein, partial [Limisphaerales bacterium]